MKYARVVSSVPSYIIWKWNNEFFEGFSRDTSNEGHKLTNKVTSILDYWITGLISSALYSKPDYKQSMEWQLIFKPVCECL